MTGTVWGTIRTGFFPPGAGGSTAVGVLAGAGRFGEASLLLTGLSGLAAVYVSIPSREVVRGE